MRGNSVETRAEPRDSRSRPLPANLAVDHAAPEGDAVSDPRSEIAAGLAGEEVEQVVPHLAEKLMPGLLFVLFAGALVSAILSTVDSVLLASAAQVSHNIVMRLRPEASERVKLLSARLTVVAMAAVACVLALTARSIRDLVEVASAAGSPGLIVCLLSGLCSQFGGPVAAAAAILAGTAVWLAGYATEFTETPHLAALAAALGAYLLGALGAAPARAS